MIRPPESFIRIREAPLLDFVSRCFEKTGLDLEYPALFGRLLDHSDLLGVRSHGTGEQRAFLNIVEYAR